MCRWNFVFWSFLFVFHAVDGDDAPQLPVWITNNPAYKNYKEIDSISTGNGSLQTNEKVNSGWLVHLNDKLGYGVEIHLEKLTVKPNDYLLIAKWPIATDKYSEIKLLTGEFEKKQKFHIPNTKSFFVLYSATGTTSPQLLLNYKRYGVSYEKNPTTENPIKKETVYEIQLKGKAPDDYSDADFLNKVKEAIRDSAKKYCLSNNIPFNDNIPTNEMVLIHRVSHCPFEWPERDFCASLQHSVFVSGKKISDGFIKDYQLTAEHLKIMWAETEHTELVNLGITIFKLPGTSEAILWWSTVVLVVMASSLAAVLIFWSVEKSSREIRFRAGSRINGVMNRRKRSKLKVNQHQEIPPFMFEISTDPKKFEEPELKSAKVDSPTKTNLKKANSESSQPPPIKNYVGGLIFSNRSFEDDEGNVVELRPK